MRLDNVIELVEQVKDITEREAESKFQISHLVKDAFHKKEVDKLEDSMSYLLKMYFELQESKEKEIAKLQKEIELLKSQKDEIHSDFVIQKAINEGRTTYKGYQAYA